MADIATVKLNSNSGKKSTTRQMQCRAHPYLSRSLLYKMSFDYNFTSTACCKQKHVLILLTIKCQCDQIHDMLNANKLWQKSAT